MVGGCDGFFKIMLDDFSDKLIIPPKFVESVFIGEQQWKAVKLSSSLGKIWTVELEDDADGYCYFGNGWKDFVQDHDLRSGYFLLFDYSGNMGFFVSVFDHTACMIRYGDSIKNGNHVNDDDDAGEEYFKIQEKSKVCKPEVIDLDRAEEEDVIHRQTRTEDKSRVDFSGKPKFRVTMKACDHLSKTSMHIIPTSFLYSNNLTCIRKATLSNSAGNWTMNVRHRLRNKRKCNEFGHGWLAFFKENMLKAGDVCIFELVSVMKNEAHFFVTREQDLIRTSSTPFTLKEEVDHEIELLPGQRTSRCLSRKRPYFTITIKKCHLSGNNTFLHVPASFSALDYISDQTDLTVVDTDGKSWKMAVCLSYRNNRKYPRLCAGWLEFCHDKKVEEGDVCTFELISYGKKAKMCVGVQKKQSPRRRSKKDEVWKQLSCRRHPRGQKMAQAKSSSTEHVEFDSSRNPQFVITLKPHNFLPGLSSQLELPRKVNGWELFSEKCKVKLVNARGKSWLVMVYRYGRRIKFGSGWLFCSRDNGLKAGDVCCFTLSHASNKDIVMRLDVK